MRSISTCSMFSLTMTRDSTSPSHPAGEPTEMSLPSPLASSPNDNSSAISHKRSRYRSTSWRRCHVQNPGLLLLLSIVVLLSGPMSQRGVCVEAANNNYYNDDAKNNYNNDDGNDDYYKNNDDGGNNYNNDDAAAAADDANAAAADDAAAAADDAYAADDAADNGRDDDGDAEAAAYRNADDDVFHWNSNEGFSGVSVMPISCVNYNGGQMIKYQLFDSDNSYQCHFSEIATFVVSIAHYMRAYFNHQALVYGTNFELPGDAGYLNCIKLQETQNRDGSALYAKIGCVDRETFTSTKLQLHVYTDAQCSQLFDDGQSSKQHATKGYNINGYYFPTRVSFRPPFYNCESCTPESYSDTFNKQNSNWYDDYYISEKAKENNGEDDQAAGDDQYLAANDDVGQYGCDDCNYNAFQDDAYNANDDANQNDGGDDANQNDDGNNNNANNDDGANYYQNYYYNRYKNNDDDFYKYNDDDARRMRGRRLYEEKAAVIPEAGQLEAFHDEFWSEYNEMQNQKRSLYENNYDVGDWNMCQRIYKYGVWCDEECRALDFFRTDQWSASDIFLLSIMCTFVTAMMLLVVAKRLKAQQKAKVYGEDTPMPGLPPFAMALIFVVIMTVIVALAKLHFVNETLVFAVVTCILLFIYMLKLTLFETRRPVLLAAPRHHEMFDSPLDEHLFD